MGVGPLAALGEGTARGSNGDSQGSRRRPREDGGTKTSARSGRLAHGSGGENEPRTVTRSPPGDPGRMRDAKRQGLAGESVPHPSEVIDRDPSVATDRNRPPPAVPSRQPDAPRPLPDGRTRWGIPGQPGGGGRLWSRRRLLRRASILAWVRVASGGPSRRQGRCGFRSGALGVVLSGEAGCRPQSARLARAPGGRVSLGEARENLGSGGPTRLPEAVWWASLACGAHAEREWNAGVGLVRPRRPLVSEAGCDSHA